MTPQNKAMKLTKLSAALRYGRHGMHVGQVPPRARAASMDAGTASQLIASVGRTSGGRSERTTEANWPEVVRGYRAGGAWRGHAGRAGSVGLVPSLRLGWPSVAASSLGCGAVGARRERRGLRLARLERRWRFGAPKTFRRARWHGSAGRGSFVGGEHASDAQPCTRPRRVC